MTDVSKDSLVYQVFGSPGYSSSLALSSDELSLFRELVEEHWLSIIRKEHPELENQFSKLGMRRYHEMSHLIDHDKLWHKSNRILPKNAVEVIKSMPFISLLINIFGPFDISDGVYEKTSLSDQEEIYWRLVRPNIPSDVGPVHADKWFHSIKELTVRGKDCNDRRSVKLWLPLYCDAGNSGLKIVPNSHLKDWNYKVIDCDNIPRLEFKEDVDAILIPTPPGNFLLFNESTLHAGAINQSNETRISVEISMVLENS